MKTYWLNDIRYCEPYCMHLQGDSESVNKSCGLDGKPLQFYDWHIAHCKDDPMRLNEDELPGCGSYWLNDNGFRYRVIGVANYLKSKEVNFVEQPTVVYMDGNYNAFTKPLDIWFRTMTWIPPREVDGD